MRLQEIAEEIPDDFDEPKLDPMKARDLAVAKETGLRHEIDMFHEAQNQLVEKLKPFVHLAGWASTEDFPPLFIGRDDAKIDEFKARGFLPVFTRAGNQQTKVLLYVKITPENQSLVKKLEGINRKWLTAHNALEHNSEEIRKSKGRISAWERKQPGYVKRDEAKDSAKILADKFVEWSVTNYKLTPQIRQANFWKKAKKAVVSLFFHERPLNGDTLWQFYKSTIRPGIDKYLKDAGYTDIRIKTNYEGPQGLEVIMFIPAKEVIEKNA